MGLRIMHRTLPSSCVLLAFVAFTVGCDSGPSTYEQLGIAEVTGRVTLDGAPLAAARVIFTEPGAGFSSVGETDANGEYRAMLNSTQSGVAPGTKVVRITTGFALDEGGPRGLEAIPKRYNSASELRATIEPGGTHRFDFDLTSDGEIEQPKLPALEE